MALYDITHIKQSSSDSSTPLIKLRSTSFAEQGIMERQHIQAALRDYIEVIDSELLVVSEEYSEFEGVSRRIDLLCVDRYRRLVVIEIKRTVDGGHMELQALRYAAMVSTMTFSHLAKVYAAYRVRRGELNTTAEEAASDLLEWFDESEEPVEDGELSRDVGIILASEDFSQEITTTVLWLNEFHDFDIRCVRLTPYTLEDRIILDAQQVIPLPEASDYTVKAREKETASKQAKRQSVDRTKFIIETPTGRSEPLPKRWATLELVQRLIEFGVPMAEVRKHLLPSKTLVIDGVYDNEDELWAAARTQHGRSHANRIRWHLASPIVENGRTWLIANNWGSGTRTVYKDLVSAGPAGFQVHEEGHEPVD